MNELTLIEELQSEKKQYCSMMIETEEDKKKLFNTLESADMLLNDCIGQEINLKDIYIEEKEVIDREINDDGEIVKEEKKIKYRTILFDENGMTYATGSYTIVNLLRRLFQAYGLPETWEKPLKVKVVKKTLKDGKSGLSLELV